MMKPCGAQVSNSVDGARSWYRLIGQRNGIVVDLLKKLTPTGLVAQVNPTAFDYIATALQDLSHWPFAR